LVRILGNDLPPCHAEGQTLSNLRHILDHEPPLPQCTKHWILNRICNRAAEEELLCLLDARGQSFRRIPFEISEYRALPEKVATPSFDAPWFKFAMRRRKLLHASSLRLDYVTNVNRARNFAIEFGARFAELVLPWDGNCFLTLPAWREILDAVTKEKPLYLAVPMVRCRSNDDLDMSRIPPLGERTEEPQLGFNIRSEARFNPSFYYGRRDKVAMLWRLGVPGPWDNFVDEPWDPPRPALAEDRQRLAHAGWVYRLQTGAPMKSGTPQALVKRRQRAREIASLELLRRLKAETESAASRFAPDRR